MDERALVLGGGGSAGNAWLIGVVAGLLEGGLDVTEADLVIGTSAGATAAVQVTGASATELLADILAAEPPPRTARSGPDGARARAGPRGRPHGTDGPDHRRRAGCGRHAPQAGCGGTRAGGRVGRRGAARWRAIVAGRLPSQQWPERPMLITAVDARTGEPVVFDRHSGVELADAVAASTSSGVAYGIGDGRYIDGGYRRNENADLAAGYARVLVLSPLGGRTRHPLEWGMQLAAQVDELRAGGSRVETILPDSDSLERVRQQPDGSVDASAGRSSRLRAGQGRRRAAQRVLALMPDARVWRCGPVGVTLAA